MWTMWWWKPQAHYAIIPHRMTLRTHTNNQPTVRTPSTGCWDRAFGHHAFKRGTTFRTHSPPHPHHPAATHAAIPPSGGWDYTHTHCFSAHPHITPLSEDKLCNKKKTLYDHVVGPSIPPTPPIYWAYLPQVLTPTSHPTHPTHTHASPPHRLYHHPLHLPPARHFRLQLYRLRTYLPRHLYAQNACKRVTAKARCSRQRRSAPLNNVRVFNARTHARAPLTLTMRSCGCTYKHLRRRAPTTPPHCCASRACHAA